MATPQTARTRTTTKKPLGRRSVYRSKKPKVIKSYSMTVECAEQVAEMIARQDKNASEWHEDVMWRESRRKRKRSR